MQFWVEEFISEGSSVNLGVLEHSLWRKRNLKSFEIIVSTRASEKCSAAQQVLL